MLPKAVKEVEQDAFGFVDYGDEFEDDNGDNAEDVDEEPKADMADTIGKKVLAVNKLQKAEIAQF